MFAHVLAKTIIDETGDGNSRVPVKSKYHRYQADTSMPFVSAGVNHMNIHLSDFLGKPKGVQDT